jgi:hypothetical protein
MTPLSTLAVGLAAWTAPAMARAIVKAPVAVIRCFIVILPVVAVSRPRFDAYSAPGRPRRQEEAVISRLTD